MEHLFCSDAPLEVDRLAIFGVISQGSAALARFPYQHVHTPYETRDMACQPDASYKREGSPVQDHWPIVRLVVFIVQQLAKSGSPAVAAPAPP